MSTSNENKTIQKQKETNDLMDNILDCIKGKNYYIIADALVSATANFVYQCFVEADVEEFFDTFKSNGIKAFHQIKEKNEETVNDSNK